HDDRGGQPDQLGGGDIIPVLLDHHATAHGAGILHPEAQDDLYHQHRQRTHGVEPVAEYGFSDAVDQQRGQDGGESELHVGDAHDQAVDGAADIARDQPPHDS